MVGYFIGIIVESSKRKVGSVYYEESFYLYLEIIKERAIERGGCTKMHKGSNKK